MSCANPDLIRTVAGGLRVLCLDAAQTAGFGLLDRLPRSLKIIAEDMLWRLPRDQALVALDGLTRRQRDAVISLAPGRALLQDFLGIPLMTDFAAMRDMLVGHGRDPRLLDPVIAVDFVVDHSLNVLFSGSPQAAALNRAAEMDRNRERFAFIKWCQQAFANFRVIPPGRGIMHQVNLEWLASVVRQVDGIARPDTMIGTDSHTTMVNALGVLGWGVGGIEAEMAMLGLPLELRLPRVVGLRLTGDLAQGVTATDLVLALTQALRQIGVIDDFVEFFGDGVARLPLADRATIANMAPEFGATCAYFPIDDATIRYLQMTGRSNADVARVAAYARAMGLWQDQGAAALDYDVIHDFDLSSVMPCMAGPTRPDQRVPLAAVGQSLAERAQALGLPLGVGDRAQLGDGSVVIAAITSCTNTSNPALMITAGLLAQRANARGLRPKPWVKTSLAPGSRVVTDYLDAAGLTADLDALGFHTIGYGCTTCNGNSGPLDPQVAAQIDQQQLLGVAVLSGNRNFEGRIHPQIKAAYLASPPLVIAAALAGHLRDDLANAPLGQDAQGIDVYLRDLWPDPAEVAALVTRHVTADLFAASYGAGMDGSAQWAALDAPRGLCFPWDQASDFIRPSPFAALGASDPLRDPRLADMRSLLVLGDRITTDHISPNGAIRADSPAGIYLQERGTTPAHLGNFGLRRGNDAICLHGMFDNPQLENALAAPHRGNLTVIAPDGPRLPIVAAAAQLRAQGRGMIIVAGRDYGAGSSRDWAAKGLRLLGVNIVLAVSFERIHRANLIGMGIIPLVFDGPPPADAQPEVGSSWAVSFDGSDDRVKLQLRQPSGAQIAVPARLALQSPAELALLRRGGVLSQLCADLLGQ